MLQSNTFLIAQREVRNLYYIQEKKETSRGPEVVSSPCLQNKILVPCFYIYIFTVVVILPFNIPYFSTCAQTENLLSAFRTCCVTSLCLSIFDFIVNALHITFFLPTHHLPFTAQDADASGACLISPDSENHLFLWESFMFYTLGGPSDLMGFSFGNVIEYWTSSSLRTFLEFTSYCLSQWGSQINCSIII